MWSCDAGGIPGSSCPVSRGKTGKPGKSEGGWRGPSSSACTRGDEPFQQNGNEVQMKMVKSLLLGSAAGIVAVAGAQAADLPVKAKPVEYVKVCSLYGAGFFYIPGTDTCIKLGGAVRVQAEFNTGAGGVPVGIGSAGEALQGQFTRAVTNDTNFRTRIYFSVDARQQTEYGTLRSYVRFGVQQTTPADTIGGSVYWDRAFIQFAGFTVGRTVSFYDSNTFADFAYNNPRTTFDS